MKNKGPYLLLAFLMATLLSIVLWRLARRKQLPTPVLKTAESASYTASDPNEIGPEIAGTSKAPVGDGRLNILSLEGWLKTFDLQKMGTPKRTESKELGGETRYLMQYNKTYFFDGLSVETREVRNVGGREWEGWGGELPLRYSIIEITRGDIPLPFGIKIGDDKKRIETILGLPYAIKESESKYFYDALYDSQSKDYFKKPSYTIVLFFNENVLSKIIFQEVYS